MKLGIACPNTSSGEHKFEIDSDEYKKISSTVKEWTSTGECPICGEKCFFGVGPNNKGDLVIRNIVPITRIKQSSVAHQPTVTKGLIKKETYSVMPSFIEDAVQKASGSSKELVIEHEGIKWFVFFKPEGEVDFFVNETQLLNQMELNRFEANDSNSVFVDWDTYTEGRSGVYRNRLEQLSDDFSKLKSSESHLLEVFSHWPSIINQLINEGNLESKLKPGRGLIDPEALKNILGALETLNSDFEGYIKDLIEQGNVLGSSDLTAAIKAFNSNNPKYDSVPPAGVTSTVDVIEEICTPIYNAKGSVTFEEISEGLANFKSLVISRLNDALKNNKDLLKILREATIPYLEESVNFPSLIPELREVIAWLTMNDLEYVNSRIELLEGLHSKITSSSDKYLSKKIIEYKDSPKEELMELHDDITKSKNLINELKEIRDSFAIIKESGWFEYYVGQVLRNAGIDFSKPKSIHKSVQDYTRVDFLEEVKSNNSEIPGSGSIPEILMYEVVDLLRTNGVIVFESSGSVDYNSIAFAIQSKAKEFREKLEEGAREGVGYKVDEANLRRVISNKEELLEKKILKHGELLLEVTIKDLLYNQLSDIKTKGFGRSTEELAKALWLKRAYDDLISEVKGLESYLPTSSDFQELINSLQAISNGGLQTSPEIKESVTEILTQFNHDYSLLEKQLIEIDEQIGTSRLEVIDEEIKMLQGARKLLDAQAKQKTKLYKSKKMGYVISDWQGSPRITLLFTKPQTQASINQAAENLRTAIARKLKKEKPEALVDVELTREYIQELFSGAIGSLITQEEFDDFSEKFIERLTVRKPTYALSNRDVEKIAMKAGLDDLIIAGLLNYKGESGIEIEVAPNPVHLSFIKKRVEGSTHNDLRNIDSLEKLLMLYEANPEAYSLGDFLAANKDALGSIHIHSTKLLKKALKRKKKGKIDSFKKGIRDLSVKYVDKARRLGIAKGAVLSFIEGTILARLGLPFRSFGTIWKSIDARAGINAYEAEFNSVNHPTHEAHALQGAGVPDVISHWAHEETQAIAARDAQQQAYQNAIANRNALRGEEFIDSNNDGVHNQGETFTDLDGDNTYDAGGELITDPETGAFTDLNGNGARDVGYHALMAQAAAKDFQAASLRQQEATTRTQANAKHAQATALMSDFLTNPDNNPASAVINVTDTYEIAFLGVDEPGIGDLGLDEQAMFEIGNPQGCPYHISNQFLTADCDVGSEGDPNPFYDAPGDPATDGDFWSPTEEEGIKDIQDYYQGLGVEVEGDALDAKADAYLNGEPFVDSNQNDRWDPGEAYTEIIVDGHYTEGAVDFEGEADEIEGLADPIDDAAQEYDGDASDAQSEAQAYEADRAYAAEQKSYFEGLRDDLENLYASYENEIIILGFIAAALAVYGGVKLTKKFLKKRAEGPLGEPNIADIYQLIRTVPEEEDHVTLSFVQGSLEEKLAGVVKSKKSRGYA